MDLAIPVSRIYYNFYKEYKAKKLYVFICSRLICKRHSITEHAINGKAVNIENNACSLMKLKMVVARDRESMDFC